MNSYSRIMSCMRNNKVDRVPVSGLLSLYGSKLINASTKDYYQNPLSYVEGQNAVVKAFDPDILFTPFALAMEVSMFGCDVVTPEKSFPYISKRASKSIHQFKDIIAGSIDRSIFLKYFFPAARQIVEQYKGEKAIGAFWLDPYDLLLTAVGPEIFVELCLFNESEFKQIIRQLTPHSLWVAERYLEIGVDFLVIPGGVFNSSLLTKEMLESIILGNINNLFKTVGGPIVLHNGGYKFGNRMMLYNKLPNLIGIVINKADSLEEAFDLMEGKLIIGNISSLLIHELEPSQITRVCMAMLEKAKGHNNYVLMTSEADIDYEANEDQVRALIQATSKYEVNQGAN